MHSYPFLIELITCIWYALGKNLGPDLVRSGRTRPANLGVRSCPVRKLICLVRSSPKVFANCWAFDFYFSFSRERKHEKIERKFNTQNSTYSSSSSSSSGKSASSNSSKKLQTGNGNNVRRSSFTEFCKKNCKLPRRTSGATAAAAASGWVFVLFQLSVS